MNRRTRLSFVAVCVFSMTGIVIASPPRLQKALWIESKDNGDRKTTIAVTEGIARLFLESTNFKVNDSENGELVTKEMLLSVLNGDEEKIEARDKKGEATIYVKKLNVPGKSGDKTRLVMETFESGRSKIRITLPEIEFESSSDEGNTHSYMSLMLSWKSLLPFLAKEGGAVYIRDHEKDSDFWVYVE